MGSHQASPTVQLNGIHQQFHTKSYSTVFECPVCGKRQRFNLNYLGNRRIPMCDGDTMKASARMDFAEWRSLKDMAINLKGEN